MPLPEPFQVGSCGLVALRTGEEPDDKVSESE